MKLSGARILLECLKREGVDIVFGLPGGAVLPIYDALYDFEGLRHILVRQEAAAGHAAEGYARTTGKVGVCMVTSGPAATNLVTALQDALMDSIPIVAFTGQVPTHLIGNDAFQEADTVGITRSITKHNFLVKRVEDLPHVMHEAFHIATTGRPGPVVVDIPKDVQFASAAYVGPGEARFTHAYQPRTKGDPEKIAEAVALLAGARRPILYTGGGIINADACAELVEFAELVNVPVIPTLMGWGAIGDDHREVPREIEVEARLPPARAGGDDVANDVVHLHPLVRGIRREPRVVRGEVLDVREARLERSLPLVEHAREIRRVGDRPGVVQVLMPSGARIPYGQRIFHPIYAAAVEHGLPVAIHPGTEGVGISGAPTAAGYPSSYLEWHTGLVGSFIAHLISLVTEGVFIKFPELKFVLIEGGVCWLPPLLWRLDKNWRALRQTAPWLDRLPSEIVFEALPEDDPQQRQPDITRARELLGWEPTIALEEGLRRLLAFHGHVAEPVPST